MLEVLLSWDVKWRKGCSTGQRAWTHPQQKLPEGHSGPLWSSDTAANTAFAAIAKCSAGTRPSTGADHRSSLPWYQVENDDVELLHAGTSTASGNEKWKAPFSNSGGPTTKQTITPLAAAHNHIQLWPSSRCWDCKSTARPMPPATVAKVRNDTT